MTRAARSVGWRYATRVNAVADVVSAVRLPGFDRPPVVEVALAVDFQPIVELTAVKLSGLAALWRDEYPLVQEHAALPLNPPVGGQGQFPTMFMRLGGATQLRLWLLAADETKLLQVQWDRLILNWRRLGEGTEYPSFAELQPRFATAWEDLTRYLASNVEVPAFPMSVEVAYVNEVVTDADGEPRLTRILRDIGDLSGLGGHPTSVQMNRTYETRSPRGLLGSLTVAADTGGRGPNGTLVTLTYRAAVSLDGGGEELIQTMNHGHETVVNAFDRMTTDEMHDVWRRRV